MIKKILLILVAISLTSCSTIKEKMPKMERKACTGENKTLADVWCKKDK
jgi:entry exclusion lipoprotein TrbK